MYDIKPSTCSSCPFARHIDGNRYECTNDSTTYEVVRGHWNPTIDCESGLQKAYDRYYQIVDILNHVYTQKANKSP